jgi:hypothetical protein
MLHAALPRSYFTIALANMGPGVAEKWVMGDNWGKISTTSTDRPTFIIPEKSW